MRERLVAGPVCHASGHRAGRGRSVTLVVALAVTLLVSGCDASGRASPSERASVATTAGTGPSHAGTGAPGAAATAPAVVDALAAWGTVAGPTGELLAVSDFRPDAFTAKLKAGADEAVAIFRDGQRLVHPTGPGFIVQDSFLVGDDVVFGVANEEKGEFDVYRWDGAAATPETLIESTGKDWWWSETAVIGTSLYYTTHGACIEAMDLSRPNPREHVTQVACAAPGEELSGLFAADSVLSYLSAAPKDACYVLYRVVSPGSTPERVQGTGCIAQGVADAHLAVWNEAPVPDSNGYRYWFDVPLHGVVDGQEIDLGRGGAGAATICGGTLYWTKAGDATASAEIRRWRPGGSIEVIYRSPDEDIAAVRAYSTSRPTCSGGMVGVQRSGWWAYGGDEFLTTPSLGWTANLELAAPRPSPRPSP